MSDMNMVIKKLSDENAPKDQNGAMAVEEMISGLRQLASMNNVLVSVLETKPSGDVTPEDFSQRRVLVVFAEADVLRQKEAGKEIVMESLRRAASVKKGMVYCPCRLCRLTPRGNEDFLTRYAEASRAIRETAALRELFRA